MLGINNIIMGKHIIKGKCLAFLLVCVALLKCSNSSSGSQCQRECVQAQNGCEVCFKSCPSTHETVYLFDSCTQTQENSASNNSTAPSSSTVFNYDSVGCGYHCCDDRFKKFQNPSITSCPASASDQGPVVIIVISILSVIFVGLCCLISGNSKIREKFIRCICKQKEEKIGGSNNSTFMLNSVEIITPEERKNSKTRYFEQKDEICSICLEEKSNTVTHCGHHYHFECLYEWMTRKPKCPLCKSANMKTVYLLCKKCFKRKGQTKISEAPFLRLDSQTNFECDQCRDK